MSFCGFNLANGGAGTSNCFTRASDNASPQLVMPKGMIRAFFGRIKSQFSELEARVDGSDDEDRDVNSGESEDPLNRSIVYDRRPPPFTLQSFENLAALLHAVIDREVEAVKESYDHSVRMYSASGGADVDASTAYSRAKALNKALLLLGDNTQGGGEKLPSIQIGSYFSERDDLADGSPAIESSLSS